MIQILHRCSDTARYLLLGRNTSLMCGDFYVVKALVWTFHDVIESGIHFSVCQVRHHDFQLGRG